VVSKARLVITAITKQGLTQAEAARTYGISEAWASRLMARYRTEGETAYTPRSRRPKTSPTALDQPTVELILRLRLELSAAGLDAGPETIAWHLAQHHSLVVSRATISRHLAKAGLITPEPKKRPKSSYIRFQARMPNETWQSDFTHYRLANGRDVEIITWLDDCTRNALHVTAHTRITATIVTTTFRQTTAQQGIPASTLTDNGMVYTTRLAGAGRQGGRNSFEVQLRTWNVTQKNSRPSHPTTCGKVERFQQTLKKWLRAQPNQPATIAELQTLIDTCSSMSTTTAARTAPCHTEQHPQPSTTPSPKPSRPAPATPTPTTGSATTSPTTTAPSPSASPANSATSASDEPTPEPTSSCSSATSRSASSTRSQASSSANSPSTRTRTTNPKNPRTRTHSVGPGLADVLRHHTVGLTGFEPVRGDRAKITGRSRRTPA